MKILLVTTYFSPDGGAAAVRLTRLAKSLQARGHHVTVLTTMPHYPQGSIRDGYRGRFSKTEVIDGIRVIRTWLWATPATSIVKRLISQTSFMLTSFFRGLRIDRPDVVLVESQPVFTALSGAAFCKLRRIPYVCNVSDVWPEYLTAVGAMTERNVLYKTFRFFVNWVERGARGIVGLYPSIINSIAARIGPGYNREVIYNAVDLDRFKPDADKLSFLEAHNLTGKRIVSFVGTFGTHIDFDTMLDTADLLARRKDTLFVFIGTGGQRELVRDRIAKMDNIAWIGWVDHADMPGAWAASDVTFWAIRSHPLYRVILQSKIFEAFASGIPVAIATEGITSEIVEASGAGTTVPFGDSIGLANAIEQILDNHDQRKTLALNARTYAKLNFDPERVTDRYTDVLERAIKPHSG